MKTLAQLTSAHSFEVLEHLEAEMQIPVLPGLQAQGDLFIIPASFCGPVDAGTAIEVPAAGVAVIEAAGAGHEHRLFASVPGTAWWAPARGTGQDIGILKCAEPVYILHREHGATGIAPCPEGYVLRRQREQAARERLVAD